MKFRAIIDNEIKHFTLRDIAIYGATNVYDPYCDLHPLLCWLAAGNQPDRFLFSMDIIDYDESIIDVIDVYQNDVISVPYYDDDDNIFYNIKFLIRDIDNISSDHKYIIPMDYKPLENRGVKEYYDYKDLKKDLKILSADWEMCLHFKKLGNVHQNPELMEGLKTLEVKE